MEQATTDTLVQYWEEDNDEEEEEDDDTADDANANTTTGHNGVGRGRGKYSPLLDPADTRGHLALLHQLLTAWGRAFDVAAAAQEEQRPPLQRVLAALSVDVLLELKRHLNDVTLAPYVVRHAIGAALQVAYVGEKQGLFAMAAAYHAQGIGPRPAWQLKAQLLHLASRAAMLRYAERHRKFAKTPSLVNRDLWLDGVAELCNLCRKPVDPKVRVVGGVRPVPYCTCTQGVGRSAYTESLRVAGADHIVDLSKASRPLITCATIYFQGIVPDGNLRDVVFGVEEGLLPQHSGCRREYLHLFLREMPSLEESLALGLLKASPHDYRTVEGGRYALLLNACAALADAAGAANLGVPDSLLALAEAAEAFSGAVRSLPRAAVEPLPLAPFIALPLLRPPRALPPPCAELLALRPRSLWLPGERGADLLHLFITAPPTGLLAQARMALAYAQGLPKFLAAGSASALRLVESALDLLQAQALADLRVCGRSSHHHDGCQPLPGCVMLSPVAGVLLPHAAQRAMEALTMTGLLSGTPLAQEWEAASGDAGDPFLHKLLSQLTVHFGNSYYNAHCQVELDSQNASKLDTTQTLQDFYRKVMGSDAASLLGACALCKRPFGEPPALFDGFKGDTYQPVTHAGGSRTVATCVGQALAGVLPQDYDSALTLHDARGTVPCASAARGHYVQTQESVYALALLVFILHQVCRRAAGTHPIMDGMSRPPHYMDTEQAMQFLQLVPQERACGAVAVRAALDTLLAAPQSEVAQLALAEAFAAAAAAVERSCIFGAEFPQSLDVPGYLTDTYEPPLDALQLVPLLPKARLPKSLVPANASNQGGTGGSNPERSVNLHEVVATACALLGKVRAGDLVSKENMARVLLAKDREALCDLYDDDVAEDMKINKLNEKIEKGVTSFNKKGGEVGDYFELIGTEICGRNKNQKWRLLRDLPSDMPMSSVQLLSAAAETPGFGAHLQFGDESVLVLSASAARAYALALLQQHYNVTQLPPTAKRLRRALAQSPFFLLQGHTGVHSLGRLSAAALRTTAVSLPMPAGNAGGSGDGASGSGDGAAGAVMLVDAPVPSAASDAAPLSTQSQKRKEAPAADSGGAAAPAAPAAPAKRAAPAKQAAPAGAGSGGGAAPGGGSSGGAAKKPTQRNVSDFFARKPAPPPAIAAPAPPAAPLVAATEPLPAAAAASLPLDAPMEDGSSSDDAAPFAALDFDVIVTQAGLQPPAQ